uniref:CSON014758 protein n=1 Tax=Culicoides sonorensis TaxID=179676 RepID=A0A336MBP8_CULSO
MNFKLPIHHQYYRSSRGKNIVKKYKKIKIKDGKMNANVVSRSKVLLRIDLSRFGLPTLASCHQNNLTSWHHRKIRCYCTTDTKIPEKNSPSLGQTPPSTNTLNDNKLVEGVICSFESFSSILSVPCTAGSNTSNSSKSISSFLSLTQYNFSSNLLNVVQLTVFAGLTGLFDFELLLMIDDDDDVDVAIELEGVVSLFAFTGAIVAVVFLTDDIDVIFNLLLELNVVLLLSLKILYFHHHPPRHHHRRPFHYYAHLFPCHHLMNHIVFRCYWNCDRFVSKLTFLGHHLLMDHTHVVVDGNNCTEEVDIMFPYSLLPVLTKTRGADSEIAVLPDSVCCGLICCVE